MMRPREKAFCYGLPCLSEEELLALLLETGSPSCPVEELSKKLLLKYGSLSSVLFEKEGLVKEKGVGKVKKLRISCALEMIRRYSLSAIKEIRDSSEAYLLTKTFFYHRKKEALLIFHLDGKGKVKEILRKDSLFYDRVSLDESYKNLPGVMEGDTLLFVHNHPSQCLSPSSSDLICLDRIREELASGKLKLMDFIIVSDSGFASLSRSGSLQSPFSCKIRGL